MVCFALFCAAVPPSEIILPLNWAELNEIFRQTGLASEFGFEIPVDFSFTENINENLNQFINDLEGSEINIPLSMNLMESTDYQYQLDKLNAEVEKGTIFYVKIPVAP